MTVVGRRPRTDFDKRRADALKSRFYGTTAGQIFLAVCLGWVGALALVGRAWPVEILAACLFATACLVVLTRLPDWWLLPWYRLWITISVDRGPRMAEALGVKPPARLTSEWLDGRPPGTVPDWVRAWVMTNEGKAAEARALAGGLATETPLERYRRAMTVANLDLHEGRPADFSAVRREAAALEVEERIRALRSIANNESVAAIMAGRSLRELTPPDTSQMRFGFRQWLVLLVRLTDPLATFIVVFVMLYALVSILGFLLTHRSAGFGGVQNGSL